MSDLKLSYELDKLDDIVEERIRLSTVLGIQPSSRDNASLKKQLSKVLDQLNECSSSEEDASSLERNVTRYSEILQKIPDGVIDAGLYEFQMPVKAQSSSSSSNGSLFRDQPKKVRFKDENLVSYSDVDQFRPYHDDVEQVRKDPPANEDEQRNRLLAGVEPPVIQPASDTLSNQEIFAQQQQQLLEQDTYLSSLSESVHRSHAISLDINDEVVEQNDHVLRDLESLVDNSGRNLDRAKRRLETFEKTARENGPCFIIVLLILILLILLILL